MSQLAELFAKQMRELREAHGLSQEALGHKIGLDRVVVSRIERSAPNLTIARAVLIATALESRVGAMLKQSAGFSETPPGTPAARQSRAATTISDLAPSTRASSQTQKKPKSRPLRPDDSGDVLARVTSRIRALREKSGKSQRELADIMKVDRNWVSAVESGRENLSFSTVERFANALGTDPVSLLDRVTPRKPTSQTTSDTKLAT
jgi:transcriptional regulator with XRE-family HTH domain